MTEFREKDMVKVAALVAQLQDEIGRKDDLIAVHKDNEARMAKRIAKLVKERDEARRNEEAADELADKYRQINIALEEKLYTLVAIGGTA